MYLSILMLMNSWVILNLWLLWKGLLWTFIYIYFSEHIYTFLSHVHLRMEMLSHNIWIFRFWKCWQFPRVFVLSYTPSSHIWEFSFLQGPEHVFNDVFISFDFCLYSRQHFLIYVFSSQSCQIQTKYITIFCYLTPSSRPAVLVNPLCLLI